MLEEGSRRKREYMFFDEHAVVDNCISLWRLTGSLPDDPLLNWLLEKTDFRVSMQFHDVFILHAALRATEPGELECCSVDFMFRLLARYANVADPVRWNVHVVGEERIIRSDMANWNITYPRVDCREFRVAHEDGNLRAIYSRMGDCEEHVEALLVENKDCYVYYAPTPWMGSWKLCVTKEECLPQ